MSGTPISTHTALVYIMIVIAAADRGMTDQELNRIGEIVRGFPVFEGYNLELLIPTARDCAAILDGEEDSSTILGLIQQAVPERLADTAYLIACHVAVSDGALRRTERLVLDSVRSALGLDRLAAAALERAAAARFRRLDN